MSTDNRTEFNKLLEQISSTTPILFFPLRIETHFRKGQTDDTDELCVRIFPDEIFLDYLTEKLTGEEFNDAKSFWVQWYIAGGSEKREYEAWRALCNKYPVYRAAWLVRRLKPINFANFTKTGKEFNFRPFTDAPEIENNIERIYANLSSVSLNPHNAIQLLKSLLNLNRIVEKYSEIVDYLYDSIKEAAENIIICMNNILSFYKGDSRSMEPSENESVTGIKNAAESLLKNLEGKYATLDQLIKKYSEELLHHFEFPKITINTSGKPDIPVSNILPDRFLFIGEPAQKYIDFRAFQEPQEKIIQFGNKVQENLPMGIDPNEDPKKNTYKINDEGDLEIDGGIDWMIDYDKAEAAGMAITIPIDSSIEKFNYIYVLGIKEAESVDGKYLRSLFNSHNYTSSGIAMLKTATPTNIVDGMPAAYNPDPELEMRIRYDIEVMEMHDNTDKMKYDSMALAKALNMHQYYEQCFGKVGNYDNRESDNAKVAYKIIWDYFLNVLTNNKTTGKNSMKFLNQIGDFMARFVRARGPYPAFRIENKPYSILPIGDLKKLSRRFTRECPNYLIRGLIELADKWKEVRYEQVVHSENLTGSDTGKRFLEMAGQTPYSTTFYERTLLNSPLLPPDKWYPEAMKTHFDLLHRYGFFDPWPVGGSEEEVSFNTDAAQLSKVLKHLKTHLKDQLPSLSEDEIKLLIAEFYDIFTHRLDAWISGVFEHIREKKCNKQPRVGAYGWVFNLERAKREEVEKETMDKIKELKLLPKNAPKDQKIYQNASGEGYIIAPSVQHALTAAVLRAAYLKTKKNEEDSHLCINLSSMRTRQALRMVDGIKQGMSTSVILGADLERFMHEAYKPTNSACEMDQYIYPLRKIFPQVISLQAEDERAHDHLMQVINGEALLNTFVEDWGNNGPVSKWLNNKYIDNILVNEKNREDCIKWFFILEEETGEIIEPSTVPTIREEHRKCLFKLIERLVDSYDALNDLLLAEGVHRLILGDTASYSAINTFMAEGKGILPEPAILDTPMEYVVVSNKTGIALPECKTPHNKPLCIAEPSIDLWLKQMTGKLDNILFYVETTNDNKEIRYETCTLNDLDINHAEYLYLSANDTLFQSFLEVRWRLKYNRLTEKIKIHASRPDENFEEIICFNEKGEAIEDVFTLYEDELRISKLRSIVMQSTEMKANDLVSFAYGDYDMEMTVDIKELKSRYNSLRTYLAQLSDNMKKSIKNLVDSVEDAFDDASLAKMYEHLCLCTSSGMFSSLPEFKPEMFVYKYINSKNDEKQFHINPVTQALIVDEAVEMQQNFLEKYKNVYEELNKRSSDAEKIIEWNSEETYTSEQYVEAIKKLLLNNFKVCPRFTLHYALTENQRKAFDDVITKGISCYRNLDALSFDEWQFDVAEVREPMKTWHHLSMFQSVTNGDTGKVSILQTDSEGTPVKEQWLGCKVAQEADLQDVDSLVIYNSGDFTKLGTATSKPAYNSGLIIDAWNEFIPYKKQTAGMVFHCDQPDNEAPQALLLAINPKYSMTKGKWQIDDILELLDFTRFMLMNRAVEPDHIYKDPELSRLFPLLSDKVLTSKEIYEQRKIIIHESPK